MARYINHGTCSRAVSFDFEDGIVHNVAFENGCNGNTKGIAALIEGMPAEEAIARMEGITCGNRPTSCPDQLARALKAELAKQQ